MHKMLMKLTPPPPTFCVVNCAGKANFARSVSYTRLFDGHSFFGLHSSPFHRDIYFFLTIFLINQHNIRT